MKVAILDGSRINPFRKLGRIADGVALIAASNGTFTADVPAPIKNSRFPDHFQVYVPRHPLGGFARLAQLLEDLIFSSRDPKTGSGADCEPCFREPRTKRAALGHRLFVLARRSVQ
jgi:hypothetical protein